MLQAIYNFVILIFILKFYYIGLVTAVSQGFFAHLLCVPLALCPYVCMWVSVCALETFQQLGIWQSGTPVPHLPISCGFKYHGLPATHCQIIMVLLYWVCC